MRRCSAASTCPYSADPEDWPTLKTRLAGLIRTRSRDEWSALLEGTDACFAPVLSMTEAPHHPHNRARATFVARDGGTQPNAAPRFSRTPSAITSAPAGRGQHTREALSDWGLGVDDIDALIADGVVAQRTSGVSTAS